MIAPHPGKPKKIPVELQLVIAFLFTFSVCQVALLLITCVRAEELHRQLLLQLILKGLLCLLALLLAVQLLLRVPFAKLCALLMLVAYPAVKALAYVRYPLRWQAAGQTVRFQEFFSTIVFLAMALLLLRQEVGDYLKIQESRESSDDRDGSLLKDGP
jgi:hypothetical protein